MKFLPLLWVALAISLVACSGGAQGPPDSDARADDGATSDGDGPRTDGSAGDATADAGTDDGAANDGPTDGGAPDDGASDGSPTDGGPDAPGDGGSDGGGSASIVRLDWRSERGPDLAAQSTDIGAADDLFAVRSEGFVARTACDAVTGECTYRWLTRAGALVREGRPWVPLYSQTPVSPDAASLLVVASTGGATCGPLDDEKPLVAGEALLVDIESGQTRASFPGYVGHPWPEFPFTSRGGWFRLLPLDGGMCGSDAEQMWRARPPYDAAPAYQRPLIVNDELPDGRWIAIKDRLALGFVSPDQPGSFDVVAPDMESYWYQGGWVNAFSREPVQEVLSADAAGGRHAWTVPPDEEWYALTAWGRWIVLYGRLDATTVLRPYRVHDMAGVHADVNFALRAPRPTQGIALAGRSDLLVVASIDEQGVERTMRFDLRTGARDTIADHVMKLVPLGDGDAVVAHDADHVLLVERGAVQELARGVIVAVYGTTDDGSSTLPLAQRDLVMIVRAPEVGQFALDAFNLRTRRLVTLTERAYWAPVVGAPPGDLCGQPWVARPAGGPIHTWTTPARSLYFVAYPDAGAGFPSLFVAPLDLTAPPRALATMVPAYCHAPLQSRDGAVIAAAIDGFDTAPRRSIRWATTAP